MVYKSMYTDEQWKWLHDRYLQGYSQAELAEFADCARNNVVYHWERMGLPASRGYLPPLNRKEFEALGRGN